MPNLIDYSFLSAREGGVRLDGYVPAPADSKSGVTIATGFDLGQRDRADLSALGLPLSLIDKLAPYLGIARFDAKKLLEDTASDFAIRRQVDRYSVREAALVSALATNSSRSGADRIFMSEDTSWLTAANLPTKGD